MSTVQIISNVKILFRKLLHISKPSISVGCSVICFCVRTLQSNIEMNRNPELLKIIDNYHNAQDALIFFKILNITLYKQCLCLLYFTFYSYTQVRSNCFNSCAFRKSLFFHNLIGAFDKNK